MEEIKKQSKLKKTSKACSLLHTSRNAEEIYNDLFEKDNCPNTEFYFISTNDCEETKKALKDIFKGACDERFYIEPNTLYLLKLYYYNGEYETVELDDVEILKQETEIKMIEMKETQEKYNKMIFWQKILSK